MKMDLAHVLLERRCIFKELSVRFLCHKQNESMILLWIAANEPTLVFDRDVGRRVPACHLLFH
jgi:hypothetical protein